MEHTSVRTCPSCSAPAEPRQRWCLECGSELPGPRRAGLRPAIGIATTLAVLVGAASAGGYTILQEGKQVPPPPTTVAQTTPATTPETLPPATDEPQLPVDDAPLDDLTSDPDFDDEFDDGPLDAGDPTGDDDAGDPTGGSGGDNGDGSVDEAPDEPASTTKEPKRQLTLTNIALGAAAVVYAPYTDDSADLGDPSRAVDGSLRTAWKAPAASDPAASPQLGLYVDLGAKERLRRLIIETPTPGMNVEIYAANSGPPATITDPGWDHLTDRKEIGEETSIKLPQRAYRYLLVWITGAPTDGSRPAIAELSILSLQPE